MPLLAVVKSGTDFRLSGGLHHVVKDLGDGMYRSIKRGVCERWLGRVSVVVAKKIVATKRLRHGLLELLLIAGMQWRLWQLAW